MTSSTAPAFRVAHELLLDRERTALAVSCGPWSVSLRGSELDDIAFDGETVLRSIRFVVRDQDWTTLPVVVDAVEPTTSGLHLRGRVGDDGELVAWSLAVDFDATSLRIVLRAEVTTAFRRARVGLIVLQSPSLAGTGLVVGHPEGSTTTTVLPEHIAPHQPAIRIDSLAWTGDHVATRVAFSGDVFEMEDQRNWTDASFKTYSTPLSLPFPVALAVGEVVEQGVEVSCVRVGDVDDEAAPLAASLAVAIAPETELAVAARRARAQPTRVEVRLGSTLDAPLPTITTAVSSDPDGGRGGAVMPSAISALLVELDPARAEWSAILDRAVGQSAGRPLDVRLVLARGEEAEPVLRRLHDDALPVARLGVFHRRTHLSESALLASVDEVLRDVWTEASTPRPNVIGGTRAHFTELNRNHARLEAWEGPLAFSITPFMHDRGGHQLVESLGVQAVVVRDAVRLANGRPLHIGPVTLGARYNAVATSAAGRGDGVGTTVQSGFGAEHVPGATDERQAATALGAWAVASVAASAVRGVESVSYFEATGPRGLVTGDGTPTGAGRALDWLAALGGLPRVAVDIGDLSDDDGSPVSVEGLTAVAALAATGDVVLVIGNLSEESVLVDLPGSSGGDPTELAAGDVLRIVVSAAASGS